jgi:protein-tyrosine phosphatase
VWVLRTLDPGARPWALRRYLEHAAQRRRRLEALRAGRAGRLVFVCHGNIMRSAFAAQVARTHLPAVADRVVGGGSHAEPGQQAQNVAIAVARELDLPLDDHRSTPMQALALNAEDVIVCMDAMNEANVLMTFPRLASRVFRVGDIGAFDETEVFLDREVHDPYDRGEAVTREAFRAISVLAAAWTDRVFAGEMPTKM